MQRKVPRSVGARYDMIETHMRRGPCVMGDAYTIAHPYLFTLA
jgi:glutathione S-transferase